MTEASAGWSDLGGMARKFHYFTDNKFLSPSLCKRYAIGSPHPLQPDSGNEGPDDCKACARALAKLRGARDGH